MNDTRTLTPDQARREEITLVERVTGHRLTRIVGPYLDPPDLMTQALVYRPSPSLGLLAVEFFQDERSGEPERLRVDGAAFQTLVDVCRRLEKARSRLGDRTEAVA